HLVEEDFGKLLDGPAKRSEMSGEFLYGEAHHVLLDRTVEREEHTDEFVSSCVHADTSSRKITPADRPLPEELPGVGALEFEPLPGLLRQFRVQRTDQEEVGEDGCRLLCDLRRNVELGREEVGCVNTLRVGRVSNEEGRDVGFHLLLGDPK